MSQVPVDANGTDDLADLVGRHFRVPGEYEVGREKVREYARAVQDHHPAHWDEAAAAALGYDGLIAPLTFTAILGALAQRAIFENLFTGYDLSQVMQTDQRLEYHKPVQVSDRLVCDIYLESFRQGHGRDVIVTKSIITDDHGGLVQTTWTTMVGRTGGAIDNDIMRVVRKMMPHSTSPRE